jgi:hypothetical protein
MSSALTEEEEECGDNPQMSCYFHFMFIPISKNYGDSLK